MCCTIFDSYKIEFFLLKYSELLINHHEVKRYIIDVKQSCDAKPNVGEIYYLIYAS